MNAKAKDVLTRALHTFWQGALASLIVTLPGVIEHLGSGWEVLRPLLISAGIGLLASGFSALKTGLIVPYLERKKEDGALTAEYRQIPEDSAETTDGFDPEEAFETHNGSDPEGSSETTDRNGGEGA